METQNNDVRIVEVNDAHFLQHFQGKADIKSYADFLKNEVSMGNANPLRLWVMMTALENSLKIAKDGIKESMMKEASKYGAKTFNEYNSEINIRDMGVRYDYSVCGYPKLNKLYSEKEILEKKIKDEETMLKTLKAPMTVVDEETGEIVTVVPPVKSSTESIAITFK